ncbi:MAG: hypothetical protein ACOC9J_02275 [Persicimonas sp.]
MMRCRFGMSALLAAVLAIGLSCVGTEVGNPADDEEAEITIEFDVVEAGQRHSLTLASGLEFDELWMVVDELEVKFGPDCGEGLVLEANAFAVEFVSQRSYPALPQFVLPVGEYCAVEFEIREAEPHELAEGVPAALAGRSALMRGTLADGRAFELTSTSDEGISLDQFLDLPAGQSTVGLTLAPDLWWTADQMREAVDDPVAINEETNPELYEAFEDSLADSFGLRRP